MSRQPLAAALREFAAEGVGHVQLVLDPITADSIAAARAAVLAPARRLTAAILAAMDESGALPLGATGRLEAVPLTNAAGDHALLVRQGEASRALLTGERGADRERVIVVPLDDDVEMRMDGDALAVWLARGSVGPEPQSIPAWANVIGMALLLLVLAFAVIGSVVVFGWLADLFT